MGLFDALKKQGKDLLQQGTDAISNLSSSLQESVNSHLKQPDINDSQLVSPEPPTQPMPPEPQMSASTVAPAQNKGLYGDYLERLIDMAITDGELTEKEKQVLFKKAESMGIDLDEFEMVLDARLFEKQKAIQTTNPIAHDSAPKSNKYGDIRKCPSCGAIVESFIVHCPDCGHEFRNIGTTSSFSLLSAKLEALEMKMTGDWKYDTHIVKQKGALIGSFPVPTTKEDILEFVSMATPLALPATKSMWLTNLNVYEYELTKAWRSKCEQVIIKARFSMKEDKELLEQIEQYAKQLKLKV